MIFTVGKATFTTFPLLKLYIQYLEKHLARIKTYCNPQSQSRPVELHQLQTANLKKKHFTILIYQHRLSTKQKGFINGRV